MHDACGRLLFLAVSSKKRLTSHNILARDSRFTTHSQLSTGGAESGGVLLATRRWHKVLEFLFLPTADTKATEFTVQHLLLYRTVPSRERELRVHIIRLTTMGDRKARLAALAAKAGRSKPIVQGETVDDDQDYEGGGEIEDTKKAISFRNYAPNDNSLDQRQQEEEEGLAESASKRPRLEEEKPSSTLEEALLQAKQENFTSKQHPLENTTIVDVKSTAPKKINWDLKRDIRDKLTKLERRTQKAIVELLKERLEHEAAQEGNSDDDSDLD
jgi:coiled-coil domain-containing protein 12